MRAELLCIFIAAFLSPLANRYLVHKPAAWIDRKLKSRVWFRRKGARHAA